MKVKVIFILVSFVLLFVSAAYAQNNPPVLDPLGNQTVTEYYFWSFPVSASDVDGDALVLSTGDLPGDAYFVDLGNGIGNLYWQTSFDDAGSYDIAFYASDGQAADTVQITVTVTNVNRDPVLDPIGDQSILQGNPLTFAVTASDPDSNPLTLNMSSTDLPVEATFTDNGDGTGSFVWNTLEGDAGDYSATFTVSDGEDETSEEINITILGRPQLDPIGNKTVAEGVLLNFAVTATDGDGDIPALYMVDDTSPSTLTLPVEATFTDNEDGTGTFVWTPGYDDAGVYGATFLAIDTVNVPPDTVSETIQITVSAVNRRPILTEIGPQTVTQGETFILGLFSVDPEGDSVYLWSSSLPLGASLFDSGNGNGTFTWTPPLSRSGSYQQLISFYASDHPTRGTDTEKVVFTVNIVQNQSPVLDPIGSQAFVAGSLFELAVAASDPNGTIPMLSAKNLPSGATFTDNDDGTGLFSWAPIDPDQVGSYNVTFFASDGASTVDSEVVSMQVITSSNQPPVLATIANQVVVEGVRLQFGITATDPNVTDKLTIGAADPPIGAVVVDNGNGTGSFDWTPTYTQAGTYYVTFFVTDGLAADSQTVTIRVDEAGNKAPIVREIPVRTVKEGDTLYLEVTAYDPEGQRVTFFSSGNGVVLPTGATITDYGTDTALIRYTPSLCQSGTRNITIVVTDGTLNGFRSSQIIVEEVGDQPAVLNPIGSLAVTEGDTLQVTVSAHLFPGCTVPSVGTSLLPPRATFTDLGNGTGRFRWIPGYTQGGDPDSVYHITFYADDGLFPADSEIVEITINDAGNQIPAFQNLSTTSYTIYADILWRLHVKAYDADSTHPVLTTNTLPTGAVFADSGNGGGLLSWTPAVADAGTYNISFYATDDLGGADTLSITVTVKPGQGEISILGVDGSYGTGMDTIITCQKITFYFKFKNNTGATVSDFKNRFRVYSPDAGVTWSKTTAATAGKLDSYYSLGGVIVQLYNADGTGSDTAFFSGSNLFGVGGAPNGFEDTCWKVTIGPLSSSMVGKRICIDRATPAGVAPNWQWKTSGVLIEPAWEGPYCFTIFDPNQNQAPTFTSAPNDTTITECESINLTMAATDADGVFPTFTVDPKPTGATVTNVGDGTGSFSWTPTGKQEGVYELAFIATDGCAADTQMVTITVNSEPAPVMNDVGNQTVKACSTLVIDLSVSEPGGPDDPIWTNSRFVDTTIKVVDHGDGTGTFTWTPTSARVGTHNVTFYVTDSDCGSVDSEVVTIEVIPDDRPTITSGAPSYTVSECDELVIEVNGSDPQGTDITFAVSNFGDTAADFSTVGNTGTLTWTPMSGWAGDYNIWFYATDECGSRDSLAVSVNVVSDSLPVITRSLFIYGQSVRSGDSVYVRGDTVIVSVSARDPEGEAMTIEVDSLPVGATFADNGLGLGVFTFFTEDAPKGTYKLSFMISDGCGTTTETVTLIDSAMVSTGVTSVGDEGELPDHFGLAQNYPNPFNPITIVEFDIPQRTHVRLDVYNVLGQHIRTLVDEVLSRQHYSVEWDGTSDGGVKVATGIYFYRMVTPEYQQTRKMILVK